MTTMNDVTAVVQAYADGLVTLERARGDAAAAELQRDLDEARHPASTLWGWAAPYPSLLPTITAQLGAPQVLRWYDNGGQGPAATTAIASKGPAGVHTVETFHLPLDAVAAGGYDAMLSQYFTGRVKRPGWWGLWHEVDKTTQDPAAFRAAWRRCHNLASESGAPVASTLILTGYKFAERLPIWYPGDDVVDVLGVDPYATSPGDTAESLLTPLLQVAAQHGKPLGLAELGAQVSDRVPFVASLGWLRRQKIAPVSYACWFENANGAALPPAPKGSTYDFRIGGTPAAAVLQGIQ